MKTAAELLSWPKPQDEILLYALLMLRNCKTKAEVEDCLSGPTLRAWGYSEALKELAATLPTILANLNTIYGEKGGAL